MPNPSSTWIEEQPTRAQRQAALADHRDEVWDGEFFMSPLPNDEHQDLVTLLTGVFLDSVTHAGLGIVRAGINLSDRATGWLQNYREPDVAVILNGSGAVNHQTHWVGAVDFLVEIVSPEDRSRDKLPFYGSLGVREVLIIDRDPWELELYRHDTGVMQLAGKSSLQQPGVLSSQVLPLTFRLEAGSPRPRVVVERTDGSRTWRV